MARVWIGTSGFSYPHWRGVFYPEGVAQKDWFGYYLEHFPTLELNATFYRLPQEKTVRRWADAAPEQFAFVVKGSRYVTHVKRLREPGEPLRRFFEPLGPLVDRLHAVLWQLPPSARGDGERLAGFLDALAQRAPDGVRHAFEFRHTSWFTDEVFDLLRDAGAACVVADAPLQALPPSKAPRRDDLPVVRVPETADFVYVRRHGPGQMYVGGYPERHVRTDADWIKDWSHGGRDVYTFYNNDWDGHAVEDARRLARRVGDAAVRPAGGRLEEPRAH